MGEVAACRDDERDAILAIVNAAAEAYRGVIPADRWHDPYMTAAELDRELAAGVVFTGCERDGALVGVMGLQPVGDVDLIRHAYVVPGRPGPGRGAPAARAPRRVDDAAAARRHLGGGDLGDPLLRAQRLHAHDARAPRTELLRDLLGHPGAPGRDVRRARAARAASV